MSIISLASNRSLWRGIDYYNNNKVKIILKSQNECDSKVQGSGINIYDVHIDMEHPRKSTCTCPFANGRKICKHMVATYFTVFPAEAKSIIKEAEEYEQEQDELREEEYEAKKQYVYSLSKEELRQILLNYMLEEYEDDYF